jgi:hypothetical protein
MIAALGSNKTRPQQAKRRCGATATKRNRNTQRKEPANAARL